MKIMRTVEKHIETHEEIDYRACDLCGRPTETQDCHDCDAVEPLQHRYGTSYPEGGDGEEIEIDLCPSCFKNKLVPWLQSQTPLHPIAYEDWSY